MNHSDGKKRLTELIEVGRHLCIGAECEGCKYKDEMDCIDRTIADFLIANDVTVQEHGRWIPVIDKSTHFCRCEMLSGYRCSVCGRFEKEKQPYCNCGAKMDLPEPPKGD